MNMTDPLNAICEMVEKGYYPTRDQIITLLDKLAVVAQRFKELEYTTRDVDTLRDRLVACEEQCEQYKAERSLTFNAARMLARYALGRLPKQHKTHSDGEVFNTANAVLSKDVPGTTPWLVLAMECMRVDKNDLPQELYQTKAKLAACEGELIEYKDSFRQQLSSEVERMRHTMMI